MTLCVASHFPTPSVLGASFLDIEAHPVHNFNAGPYQFESQFNVTHTEIDFCNVTVTYTHPGQNDTLRVNVWLPLEKDDWNGRFQGAGGGGWSGSWGPFALGPAVAGGYAVAGTDAGHAINLSLDVPLEDWALLSPGNVNLYLLQDFASVSLSDMTLIGKHVTESYYGTPPRYSYWNGCSNGGRQGLMIAQRYPDLYDGILAAAPAINWPTLFTGLYWSAQVMKDIRAAPSQVELEAIRQEAIKACDHLDGLADGIIGLPEQCCFNPYSLVGKTYNYEGEDLSFTFAGLTVASAVWRGPWSPERMTGYFGLNQDASLSVIASTIQLPNGTYVASPSNSFVQWIKYFIMKDPDFSVDAMTTDEYFAIMHAGQSQYDSIIGSNDPNLSGLRKAGGKMLTWHGLSDAILAPQGTEDYYENVLDLDPNANDFYRYFKAPGAAHCIGGLGAAPANVLNTLIQWVEEGQVPETLDAVALDGTVRPLCAYPLEQTYVGGDPRDRTSFECRQS